MIRRSLPMLLALMAAACAAPPPQTASQRSSAAVLASCRASTDASFNRQNRYLLSERDTTDAPFSASGVSGITTRGLTQRYDYDTDLSNCLAGSNGGNPNGPATSTQPAPPTGTRLSPY